MRKSERTVIKFNTKIFVVDNLTEKVKNYILLAS